VQRVSLLLQATQRRLSKSQVWPLGQPGQLSLHSALSVRQLQRFERQARSAGQLRSPSHWPQSGQRIWPPQPSEISRPQSSGPQLSRSQHEFW